MSASWIILIYILLLILHLKFCLKFQIRDGTWKKNVIAMGICYPATTKLLVSKKDTIPLSDCDFSDNELSESSSSFHSVSTSYFWLAGDDSEGFDTYKHPFESLTTNTLKLLYGAYGEITVCYKKPVVINNSYIDDSSLKKYYILSLLWIFFRW